MSAQEIVPDLTPRSIEILSKYLDKAYAYFEFGSGGSTLMAYNRNNLTIYSVESDQNWIEKLYNAGIPRNDSRINIMYIDVKTTGYYGYPGKDSTYEDWIKYSRAFTNLEEKSKKEIDLVFIDGRFRVACALNIYKEINDDTIVIFDDFLNRPYYHIVLDYYCILEKIDNRMVVLKKKPNMTIDNSIVQEYENDVR